MNSLSPAWITEKAKSLGFKFIFASSNRHKLLMPESGFGYQGSLDGCVAYLQGWEEHGKYSGRG